VDLRNEALFINLISKKRKKIRNAPLTTHHCSSLVVCEVQGSCAVKAYVVERSTQLTTVPKAGG
jgi:hypothetical protein